MQAACLGIQIGCLGIGLKTQAGCLGIRNACYGIRVAEGSGTEIRELNAEASKMDVAACEAKERIPRVGCLGIGSAKNQSFNCIRFLSLISLPRFK